MNQRKRVYQEFISHIARKRDVVIDDHVGESPARFILATLDYAGPIYNYIAINVHQFERMKELKQALSTPQFNPSCMHIAGIIDLDIELEIECGWKADLNYATNS